MGYMDEPEFASADIKSNGKSELLSPNELFITPHLQKDLSNIRIKNMVKAAKDIASNQWAVPLLLTLLLGYWIYSDQKTSGRTFTIETKIEKQNELLVRLDQQKIDQDRQTDKDKEERQRIDRETIAYINQIRVKLGVMDEKGKN